MSSVVSGVLSSGHPVVAGLSAPVAASATPSLLTHPTYTPIVFGVLPNGLPIVMGVSCATVAGGTTATTIHHVHSGTHLFHAESWDGDHEEHEHPDDARRQSIVLPDAHDDSAPVASSDQFDRVRSGSLVAALACGREDGSPLVQYHQGGGTLLAVEEEEDGEAVCPLQAAAPLCAAAQCDGGEEAGEAERALAQLLFSLRAVKMQDPAKYTDAVDRLKQLEHELRDAGAVCPPDAAVADAVARALAHARPGSDVQIRVNQSRHTTTTKTVYETETPGMAGLDPDAVRKLHQEMLSSLSAAPGESQTDAGTTQKKETQEEGFTNDDCSVVVSKKMTRVVTTTRTTLPGEGDSAGSAVQSSRVDGASGSGTAVRIHMSHSHHRRHRVTVTEEEEEE